MSAKEAEAAGLPGLGFTLETTGSGMSGSQLSDGHYLVLSGPPGGPLMLSISPTTVGAALGDAVESGQTTVEQEVELLGAKHAALAWVSGESLARTSWCVFSVAAEGTAEGDPALLISLGVGHSGDEVSCETAMKHHVLGPVLASFTLE